MDRRLEERRRSLREERGEFLTRFNIRATVPMNALSFWRGFGSAFVPLQKFLLIRDLFDH